MSGLDSDTVTAPTEELVICASVTGFQLRPPSVVLNGYTDIIGEGATAMPFANKLPEERFYNRTVFIDVIPRK